MLLSSCHVDNAMTVQKRYERKKGSRKLTLCGNSKASYPRPCDSSRSSVSPAKNKTPSTNNDTPPMINDPLPVWNGTLPARYNIPPVRKDTPRPKNNTLPVRNTTPPVRKDTPRQKNNTLSPSSRPPTPSSPIFVSSPRSDRSSPRSGRSSSLSGRSSPSISIGSISSSRRISFNVSIKQRIRLFFSRLWKRIFRKSKKGSIAGRKTPRCKSVMKSPALSNISEDSEGCFDPRSSSTALAEIRDIVSKKTKGTQERCKTRTLARHKRNSDGRYCLAPDTDALPKVNDEKDSSSAGGCSDGEDSIGFADLDSSRNYSGTPNVSKENLGPSSPVSMASFFSNHYNTYSEEQFKKAMGWVYAEPDAEERPINSASYISPQPPRAPSRAASRKYTPTRKKYVVPVPETRKQVVDEQWPGWKSTFQEKFSRKDQISSGGLSWWVGDGNPAKDNTNTGTIKKNKTSKKIPTEVKEGDVENILNMDITKLPSYAQEMSGPRRRFPPPKPDSHETVFYRQSEDEMNRNPPQITVSTGDNDTQSLEHGNGGKKHVPQPPLGPSSRSRRCHNKPHEEISTEYIPHPPAGPAPMKTKVKFAAAESSDEAMSEYIPRPPAVGRPAQRRVKLTVQPHGEMSSSSSSDDDTDDTETKLYDQTSTKTAAAVKCKRIDVQPRHVPDLTRPRPVNTASVGTWSGRHIANPPPRRASERDYTGEPEEDVGRYMPHPPSRREERPRRVNIQSNDDSPSSFSPAKSVQRTTRIEVKPYGEVFRHTPRPPPQPTERRTPANHCEEKYTSCAAEYTPDREESSDYMAFNQRNPVRDMSSDIYKYDRPCQTSEVIPQTRRNLYKTPAQVALERERTTLRRTALFEQTPYGSDEILSGRNHSREFQNIQFFKDVAKSPKRFYRNKIRKTKAMMLDEAVIADWLEGDPFPERSISEELHAHDNKMFFQAAARSPYFYNQARDPNKDMVPHRHWKGYIPDDPRNYVSQDRASENMAFFWEHSKR